MCGLTGFIVDVNRQEKYSIHDFNVRSKTCTVHATFPFSILSTKDCLFFCFPSFRFRLCVFFVKLNFSTFLFIYIIIIMKIESRRIHCLIVSSSLSVDDCIFFNLVYLEVFIKVYIKSDFKKRPRNQCVSSFSLNSAKTRMRLCLFRRSAWWASYWKCILLIFHHLHLHFFVIFQIRNRSRRRRKGEGINCSIKLRGVCCYYYFEHFGI